MATKLIGLVSERFTRVHDYYAFFEEGKCTRIELAGGSRQEPFQCGAAVLHWPAWMMIGAVN
jgi:hypothetical protein